MKRIIIASKLVALFLLFFVSPAIAQNTESEQKIIKTLTEEFGLSQDRATTYLGYMKSGLRIKDNDSGIVFGPEIIQGDTLHTQAIRAQLEADAFDQEPSFNGGGFTEFRSWVMNHLVYPEVAWENGVMGRVSVSFVVDTDGTVTNVTAKGIDGSLEKEAIRVVSSSPKWEPGQRNGKPKQKKFYMSIRFDSSVPRESFERVPFQMVEQKPSFKGGDANCFVDWLTGRVCAPRKEGRIVLSFVVTHQGDVENVHVIQGLDPELDKEVVRLASNSPHWSPGLQKGKPVDVEYSSFPVDFRNASFKIPLIGTCWETREDASSLEEGAEIVRVYQFVSEAKYIRRDFIMYKQTSRGREIREMDAEYKKEYNYTTTHDRIRVWDNFGCHGDIDLSLVRNAEGSFLFAPKNTSYPDEHEEIRLKQIKEMPHEKHLSNPEDNRSSGIMIPPERQGTSYSEREVITFSTPLDVFNFLQSRVFKSSDGITLDITPYGVKANGRAITGAVKVTYIQRQQAIMKATSPSTGHTYTFIAYADRNCIVCDDDHTMYFGKK